LQLAAALSITELLHSPIAARATLAAISEGLNTTNSAPADPIVRLQQLIAAKFANSMPIDEEQESHQLSPKIVPLAVLKIRSAERERASKEGAPRSLNL
jgi:hypothetical protein